MSNIYYVGFNSNNSILNDILFDGSITLYPIFEKNNLYFSSEILTDTTSDIYFENYKKFIYETIKKIENQNGKCRVMCFNKKIIQMCKEFPEISLIKNNSDELLDYFNNKYEIRSSLKNDIPILDYEIKNYEELNYNDLKKNIGSEKMVVQEIVGAGGLNTFLVREESDLKKIIPSNSKFCISSYVEHIPLNSTIVVGKNEILHFPSSAQLISTAEGTFKYVGGDFIYIDKYLSKKNKEKIFNYDENIGKFAQSKGYRGILGIDYILTDQDEIKFMELNPRFQSSTFMINRNLKLKYNVDMATLHLLAIENKNFPNLEFKNIKISNSFLNCNVLNNFDKYKSNDYVLEGYFKENTNSFYRKIFNYSLLNNDDFQNLLDSKEKIKIIKK